MLKAILETPKRLWDALTDPVRLRHSISRLIETVVPACLVLRLLGMDPWLAILAAILIHIGEFAIYEYILEPLGVTGRYFERGPREDETFINP